MNTTKTPVVNVTPDIVNSNSASSSVDLIEDPITRFFKSNQKTISYLLIAILISVAGFRFYHSARESALQRSAEVFANTREAYQTLASQTTGEAPDLKSLEAAKRSFEGTIKTLQDQNYPYDLLAGNYQVLAELSSGNLPIDEVKTKLERLEWAKSKNHPDALWKELVALNLAKTLLSNVNHQAYALSEIKSLAKESQYLRVLSLITWRGYANLNQDTAEQEAVKADIDQFIKDFPEQSDLLK